MEPYSFPEFSHCTVWAGFLYGMVGGFFAELRVLFKIRHNPSPKWLKSVFYWCITIVMIFSGGLLVSIYILSNLRIHPLIALNVGASAPLIFEAFISKTPPISTGEID